MSPSLTVLSSDVPPPGLCASPGVWVRVLIFIGVWALVPTVRVFFLSASSKELALVLRVRIREGSGLASPVFGAVSFSVVAYFGVHLSRWCSGLVVASPG